MINILVLLINVTEDVMIANDIELEKIINKKTTNTKGKYIKILASQINQDQEDMEEGLIQYDKNFLVSIC